MNHLCVLDHGMTKTNGVLFSLLVYVLDEMEVTAMVYGRMTGEASNHRFCWFVASFQADDEVVGFCIGGEIITISPSDGEQAIITFRVRGSDTMNAILELLKVVPLLPLSGDVVLSAKDAQILMSQISPEMD